MKKSEKRDLLCRLSAVTELLMDLADEVGRLRKDLLSVEDNRNDEIAKAEAEGFGLFASAKPLEKKCENGVEIKPN